jgi:hypothetical protein
MDQVQLGTKLSRIYLESSLVLLLDFFGFFSQFKSIRHFVPKRMLFALKNAKGIFMSKLKQRKQEKRLLDKIRKKMLFLNAVILKLNSKIKLSKLFQKIEQSN